jgi:hypothetical protein
MTAAPGAGGRKKTGVQEGPSAGSMVAAVVARPDLWWTTLGAVRRMAAPRWWRSPPYLPLPGRRLWAFRMVTAYGHPDAWPPAPDVVGYLEWCRGTAVHVGAPSLLARLAQRTNSRSAVPAG